MRFRALRDFVDDLVRGDAVALGLAGFVLLLTAAVGLVWIFELRRRNKEKAAKKPRAKQKPNVINNPR
jgi:hypothetical protein